MQSVMRIRRAAIASVLIAVVVVLARSSVVAGIVVGTLVVALVVLAVLGGRKLVMATRGRLYVQSPSRVPLAVSLGVGALVTAPQFALAHFKHAWVGVMTGILSWLVLAAFLRFVIFLADYLRRRRNRTFAQPSP